MGDQKTESWPRKVKVGNVTVKVYRVAHPRARDGFEYVMAWRGASGRERKTFASQSTAIDEAGLKAEKLNAGQVESAEMDRSDRDELVRAREIANGTPIVTALKEWAKARELTNGAVIAAAEAYSKKSVTFKKKLASEVVEEFITYKTSRGKQGERTYGSKLRPIKTYFPLRFIDEITSIEWSQYLGQWTDGVTQNDFRKRAVELCTWARDVAGYMPRSVPTEIEHTERAKESPSEIGILTPAVWEQCLRWIQANRIEHLAALVIAGFCGVRSDEIHGKREDRLTNGDACKRQTWEDIDLAQKHLNVTNAKENTPAWRLVPLCPAAIAWLKLCPGEHTGPICVPGAMEKVRWLLLNQAKIELPENCFRHSFISYEIAVSGDKAQVATWAGNSVKEIDKRYRRPKLPATGRAWMSVRPKPSKRDGQTAGATRRTTE